MASTVAESRPPLSRTTAAGPDTCGRTGRPPAFPPVRQAALAPASWSTLGHAGQPLGMPSPGPEARGGHAKGCCPGPTTQRNSVPDAGIPGGRGRPTPSPVGCAPEVEARGRVRPARALAGSGTGWLGYWPARVRLAPVLGWRPGGNVRGWRWHTRLITTRWIKQCDFCEWARWAARFPSYRTGKAGATTCLRSSATGDLDGAFLARDGLALALEALERGDLPERSIEGLEGRASGGPPRER